MAQAGGRGGAALGRLPALCRVEATLRPTSDSEIKIEVWMPAAGWNGKLEAVGNGAWAGTISTGPMATAVLAGYAATSTDTGHTGGSATFIVGHPEKLTDFAHRAVHEMTVAAKAIVAAYYGNGPKYSYFNGCSTGGRQALAAAQRYPGDFDGIIAGDPAHEATRLHAGQVWTWQVSRANQASVIPADKYALLLNASLDKCDALDGVKDGVIENPKACTVDPKVLVCKDGADGTSCLTAAQAETAAQIYAGLKDAKTGKQIFPGLEPGSESGWNSLSGNAALGIAADVYKYIVHANDPNWTYRSFDAATDVELASKTPAAVSLNADDPNLAPFFERGGKLLMYHGWADPGIAPMTSVNYYRSVLEKVGAAKSANSIRLFMVPGMGHCSGGDGTDTFDALSALDAWVQGGFPCRLACQSRRHGSHAAVVRVSAGGHIQRQRQYK
jgi:feruloyl esterase